MLHLRTLWSHRIVVEVPVPLSRPHLDLSRPKLEHIPSYTTSQYLQKLWEWRYRRLSALPV